MDLQQREIPFSDRSTEFLVQRVSPWIESREHEQNHSHYTKFGLLLLMSSQQTYPAQCSWPTSGYADAPVSSDQVHHQERVMYWGCR